MCSIIEEIKKIGIIPVIKIDDVKKAVPLAKALMAGGIPCAEITFRTAQAEESIQRIRDEVPEILLGAGTVLTADQVDKAVDAGAKFIVTPGLNPNVVSRCMERGVPITPGCSTPTDIEKALEMGVETVKIFPAEQLGGIEYIKTIAAPYPALTFIPSGGINAQTIVKYLAFERTIACGGSWMVNPDMINSDEFDKITALSREAVMNILGFETAHVGFNMENEGIAYKTATRLASLFGLKNKGSLTSIYCGGGIEVMNKPSPGKNGHIAICTNSMFRAMAYLERQGIEFNHDKKITDSKGNIYEVYLKDEIGGFAFHLLQK